MLRIRVHDALTPMTRFALLCLVVPALGCASAPEETQDDPPEDGSVLEEPDGAGAGPSGEPDVGQRAPQDGSTSGVTVEDGSGDTAPGVSADVLVDEQQDGMAPSSEGQTWIMGATLAGGEPQTVVLSGGKITQLLPPDEEPPSDAEILDYGGAWLAPAFIDSHVHIIYLPVAEALVAGGVSGVVDHAAPVSFFQESFGSLRVLGSGPMVTADGGYPTQSWGSNGYGIECGDTGEAVAAVEDLHAQGAAFIKVPLAGGPQFSDESMGAVVARAHELGLKVSVHALSETSASRAATAGADILAHTPTEPLSDGTLDQWGARAVVSTLSAFGGSAEAVDNLSALHQRGAVVLYGTDLGNTSVAAIQPTEIALLMSAGLTGAEILQAGTSAAAEWWGFDDLGALAPGKSANLMVLAADPLEDPMTLAEPVQVLVDGEPLSP